MKPAILLLAALPACCQPFSFGIIGGGIATDGLDPSAQNLWDGKRYTVGVAAELKLPLPRLSVEVDALYKHTGQRSSSCAFTSCAYSEVRANIFEFPFLLKYRLLKRSPIAPFVEAGPAYQWVRHASGTVLTWRTGPIVPDEVVDLTVHRFPTMMPAENHVGIVAGGGIELRAGPIRVSPQFRYTRWSAAYWESSGARGFFTASNVNQAEGLLSIRF
jgi:hypothetical protein